MLRSGGQQTDLSKWLPKSVGQPSDLRNLFFSLFYQP